jgi:hypothetical protein
MVLLTRWFGVTESDADRSVANEQADIEEIAQKSLLMQTNAATKQHRPLCRGTHASGVCVSERNLRCLTLPSIARLRLQRGSQRGFLRSPAYIRL